MKRRDFLTTASGVAGGAAAAGTAAAQDDEGGGGGTETVTVGPGGDLVFDPASLTIEPGTTVEFVWESNNHNLVVDSGPEDGWEGYETLEDEGFTYEHTFEVEGTYEYYCAPHQTAGMEGTITVGTGGSGGEGGEFEPATDIGVPVQKHFVGMAAFMGIFLTFVFTFYVLKYGESAHTSSPNRK